jgi:hypothetical protein
MIEHQNHPGLRQLLQSVEEGTSAWSARRVRRHVAECWKCQRQLSELQETIREFAHYYEKAFLPSLPAPPNPWPDLRAKIRQLDDVNLPAGPWSRTSAYFATPAFLSARRLILGGVLCSCALLAVTLAVRSRRDSIRVFAPAVSTPPAASTRVSEPPPPARMAPIADPAPPIPAPLATAPQAAKPENTEVRIFAALHRIGADLGDPIEVSSESSGNLRVTGIGLASSHQAEVREALASLPGVAVVFPQASASGVHDNDSRALSFEAGRSPFEVSLQQFLGGPAEWENYANEVLDESDAVLARAHALETLSEHFPPGKRTELDEAEKALLDQISDDHRTAFRQHSRQLELLVAPIREALNAPPLASEPEIESPLKSAQRMDRVLSVIFGVASTNLTQTQLIAELSQASAELQAAPVSLK